MSFASAFAVLAWLNSWIRKQRRLFSRERFTNSQERFSLVEQKGGGRAMFERAVKGDEAQIRGLREGE